MAQTLNTGDQETWLGYNDFNPEAGTVGANFSKITGGTIGAGFINFAAGQPDNSAQDCVAISSGTGGKWKDDNCFDLKPYLCELEF